jgi:hypothetical protein
LRRRGFAGGDVQFVTASAEVRRGKGVTLFSSATLANQAVSPSLTCAYLGSAAKSLEYLVSR